MKLLDNFFENIKINALWLTLFIIGTICIFFGINLAKNNFISGIIGILIGIIFSFLSGVILNETIRKIGDIEIK